MNRYWVSWEVPAGHIVRYPFEAWKTGETVRVSDFCAYRDTYCGIVDAASEEDAWSLVKAAMRSAQWRFVSLKEPGWRPPEDRFPPQTGVGSVCDAERIVGVRANLATYARQAAMHLDIVLAETADEIVTVDVPDLLTEIERLRAEVDRLRTQIGGADASRQGASGE